MSKVIPFKPDEVQKWKHWATQVIADSEGIAISPELSEARTALRFVATLERVHEVTRWHEPTEIPKEGQICVVEIEPSIPRKMASFALATFENGCWWLSYTKLSAPIKRWRYVEVS